MDGFHPARGTRRNGSRQRPGGSRSRRHDPVGGSMSPPKMDQSKGAATAFERLVRENPQLASAVLRALGVIAGADRRQVMLLIEAVSAVVVHSPKTAPRGGSEEL